MSNILSLTKNNLDEVFSITNNILLSGGVIIYPTDTIYGIGCDATNLNAINKIYSLKKRDPLKPMLMLINSFEMMNKYISNISPITEEIIHKYWPGALTILFESNNSLPQNLISSDGKVAFRFPNNEFCNKLVSNLNTPIVSTSVNISDKQSLNSFIEIKSIFDGKVDLLIEGYFENNISSTIIDGTITPPKILRQGDLIIDLEEL
ncbi:MAG: L-threonylcarbamoyladenylate synthase [Bacteroidetes bacterium]|nr:L-threonylcarbamoyladenylate synthase [Bacteroidota bacterium]